MCRQSADCEAVCTRTVWLWVQVRRFLHEESMKEGPELLILRRLEPSRGRYKHCKRSFVEEKMLPQVTIVRMTMKRK